MQTSPRPAALIAGISILLMAFAAIYSFAIVLSPVYHVNDAAATFAAISQNLDSFKMGINGWWFILIMDVLAAYGLCYVLTPVHPKWSMVVAGSRIVYGIIFAVAIYQLSLVPALLDSGDELAVLHHIDAFMHIWSWGLILFGLHLLAIGIVQFRFKWSPKWLSYLVLLAGASYMISHGLKHLPVNTDTAALVEKVLSLPMALGELLFAIWLIAKGGKSTAASSNVSESDLRIQL